MKLLQASSYDIKSMLQDANRLGNSARWIGSQMNGELNIIIRIAT